MPIKLRDRLKWLWEPPWDPTIQRLVEQYYEQLTNPDEKWFYEAFGRSIPGPLRRLYKNASLLKHKPCLLPLETRSGELCHIDVYNFFPIAQASSWRERKKQFLRYEERIFFNFACDADVTDWYVEILTDSDQCFVFDQGEIQDGLMVTDTMGYLPDYPIVKPYEKK